MLGTSLASLGGRGGVVFGWCVITIQCSLTYSFADECLDQSGGSHCLGGDTIGKGKSQSAATQGSALGLIVRMALQLLIGTKRNIV